MLDLARCAPQVNAMTLHIAARYALDTGVLGLLWTPELARQYNRLWLERYAPGYTDIPGVEQECYCGDEACKGLCVIAKRGETQMGGALSSGVRSAGEAGPKARPMHPHWAQDLRNQCLFANVAFHFKQWGEWKPVNSAGDDPDPDGRSVQALPDGTITDTGWNDGAGPHLTNARPLWRIGKKKAGRLLDGREWNEYPEVGHA